MVMFNLRGVMTSTVTTTTTNVFAPGSEIYGYTYYPAQCPPQNHSPYSFHAAGPALLTQSPRPQVPGLISMGYPVSWGAATTQVTTTQVTTTTAPVVVSVIPIDEARPQTTNNSLQELHTFAQELVSMCNGQDHRQLPAHPPMNVTVQDIVSAANSSTNTTQPPSRPSTPLSEEPSLEANVEDPFVTPPTKPKKPRFCTDDNIKLKHMRVKRNIFNKLTALKVDTDEDQDQEEKDHLGTRRSRSESDVQRAPKRTRVDKQKCLNSF